MEEHAVTQPCIIECMGNKQRVGAKSAIPPTLLSMYANSLLLLPVKSTIEMHKHPQTPRALKVEHTL